MEKLVIPHHVAIIMDGNGRWATARGLSRSMGHKEGANTLQNLAIHILNRDIKILSVFAFSTDNFKRTQKEVDYLMNLFIEFFSKSTKKFNDKKIKVVFSGRKDRLSDKLLEVIDNIQKNTYNNKKGILNICLNYGGQEEIVDAAKKMHEDISSNEISIDEINRDNFYNYLYNDLPPIDYLIRTGGELRISNFMLYQSSFAELYFTDTLFPDFNEKEFDKSLEEFENRNRRFGGNSNES